MNDTSSIDDPMVKAVRYICDVWISMPLASAGIMGNLLSVLAFCLLPGPPHPTITVLLALAITDIGILLLTLLLRSVRLLGWTNYDVWFHHVFRWLYPTTYVARLGATWLVVLLTVERYVAVCRPLEARRLITVGRTRLAVAGIAVAVVVFSLPRYFEYQVLGVPGTLHVKPYYSHVDLQSRLGPTSIIPTLLVVALRVL
jgi:hypothetical protein